MYLLTHLESESLSECLSADVHISQIRMRSFMWHPLIKQNSQHMKLNIRRTPIIFVPDTIVITTTVANPIASPQPQRLAYTTTIYN